ncbi:photosystem I reaction center subunit PsaK [filamentous cyanobacterium LEGE 11480]|uniref:Photosystem I reaction center subunit PsaK n=1 Tax=Romeriopsis navalis LEGE 11480 TaxID=2777977 RepID=A0A928VLR9_9CYAN|nr:photosystem I reaction center subunit PsaK [Romeriopsis navalis]MBE9029967.1 photosystem I reaction center subunit PsaK [Romeriopsis navalis LEGE 11480]
MLTLLAVAGDIPTTAAWTPAVGAVMVGCNILAIALGKAFMGTPSKPPALPMPEMFGGMGLPALLATTSLGHIIGFGAILGLASKGIL